MALRVLQAVNIMDRAGLETVLMNYLRAIDRERVMFDFLTHRPDKGAYEDEITALGGRIYRMPRLYPQNLPAYSRAMRTFFAEHPEYVIIHSHIDAMSLFPLREAKRAGIPVRIAHSHSAGLESDRKKPLKLLYRRFLPGAATELCACGRSAGEFLFGRRPFEVIPNAVDAKRFAFREERREKTRAALGLGDSFVVGMVGRFSPVKNHAFALEVLRELLRREPNSRLLLAGEGETREAVLRRAKEDGLAERIVAPGVLEDMPAAYAAMDALMMPSLFEGLPGAAIEAQLSGLPCLLSDRVTKEADLGGEVRFLPLERPATDWAEALLSMRGQRKAAAPTETMQRYDSAAAAKELAEYYLALANGKERRG